MNVENYWLFVLGSILLVITPGPDMAYLLARCAAQGQKAGLVAAAGFNAGGYVHLAAAILGVSAAIAASPYVFAAVKWIGAAYLIYLGVLALFSRQRDELFPRGDIERRRLRTVFVQAFLSDLLNPKVGLFFLAFLPQFVDASSPNRTQQLVFLGVTVCVIALAINIPLVLVASRASERIRGNAVAAGYLTRLMGLVFIAIGVQVALG